MEFNKLQKRMRFQPVGMKVREAGEGESESRMIEGCAIVFNQETVLWDGKYEKIREKIASSCCTKEFLAEQDIKLNLLHDRDASVARNNRGVGTLQLDLREDGLYFAAEMPKCDLGDRALELIRNKTYTGCSFEFYPEDYTEQTTVMDDGREDILITHTKFRSIGALTIAMDPAYQQTTIGERETFEKRENDIQQKREDEEAARQRALHDHQREEQIRNLQAECYDDFENY